MAVVARKRKHKVIYYVTFTFDGERVWELAGTDKTEAKRLERRRVREVANGTYAGLTPSPSTTVLKYAERWLKSRKNRTAKTEATQLRRHVLSRKWFASVRVEDAEPRHAVRLVEELKATVSETTGKPLSQKTISNIVGILSTMFRDAEIEGLTGRRVMLLPKQILRRAPRKDARSAYEAEEVRAMLTSTRVNPAARMFAALAFMTGMREGEICGRRWRDLDDGPTPLACLTVSSQYDDRPLKTEWGSKGEHPRKVPVHPALGAALGWWKRDGFRAVYGRDPTPADFIVCRRGERGHTRSTAYKMWRKACQDAGIRNRSLHSTRHTFVSLCRRGGASKDVLEQVTHNASGEIIDQYTHREWEELCAAVLALTDALTPRLTPRQKDNDPRHLLVEAQGIETGADRALEGPARHSVDSGDPGGCPVSPAQTRSRPHIATRVNGLAVSEFVGERILEVMPRLVDGEMAEGAILAALASGSEAIDSGTVTLRTGGLHGPAVASTRATPSDTAEDVAGRLVEQLKGQP
jgi:integrase